MHSDYVQIIKTVDYKRKKNWIITFVIKKYREMNVNNWKCYVWKSLNCEFERKESIFLRTKSIKVGM